MFTVYVYHLLLLHYSTNNAPVEYPEDVAISVKSGAFYWTGKNLFRTLYSEQFLNTFSNSLA
jgi:hypothetical protein